MIYVELKSDDIYEIKNPDKLKISEILHSLNGNFIRIYERIFAVSEIKQIKVEE